MSKAQVRIGALEICASRWPWQEGYNWRGTTREALLNNGARFGGGWKYKLGASSGGWSTSGIGLHLDLILGALHIEWVTAHSRAMSAQWAEEAIVRRVNTAVNAARDRLRVEHLGELAEHEDAFDKKRADLVRLCSHVRNTVSEVRPLIVGNADAVPAAALDALENIANELDPPF